MKKISHCRYTNEKRKCEKSFFCNYQSYPCQHNNNCPRKAQLGKYGSIGDKKEKKHMYAYNKLKVTVL